MTLRTYTVVGMTCSHCVAAVSEEVGGIAGVGDVVVDLETGSLTVATTDPAGSVDDAAVAAAVDEAGYTLVVR